MSSETDHPRQRTVAELLAEHGDAGATGRRRRRRAPDDEPDQGGYDAEVAAPAPRRARTPEPDRSVLREQVPQQSRFPSETSWSRPVFPDRAPVDLHNERATDVMPRVRDDAPAVDEGRTGPLPAQPAPAAASDTVAPETEALAVSGGPDLGSSTMIGVAPVEAEEWHRARTGDARRAGTAIDDGPPQASGSSVEVDDEPDVGQSDVGQSDDPDAPVDLEKHDDAVAEAPKPRERRLGRASTAAKEAAAPAWAAVVGQWVAGALGGAVLWVLFRYLWRGLPVVALAAAVLVTVGLVVIVRALLHNNDRRTTLFAVLVGLLLTVSPALLVLLGR